MLHLGEFIDVKTMANLAGVNGPRGMQSGILVNEQSGITILFQSLGISGNNKYPNQWDINDLGVLYYCGTSKGQNNSIKKQNLNSKLNKHVNEAIYPIHVFVRYPDKKFRYMGEFERLYEYDRWVNEQGKEIYIFGLRSKYPDKIRHIIKELIKHQ